MGQCRHVLRLDALLMTAKVAATPPPLYQPADHVPHSIPAIFLAIFFTEFACGGMQLRNFFRPPIGLCGDAGGRIVCETHTA